MKNGYAFIAVTVVAAAAFSSCAPSPKPFDFTFAGVASGSGLVMVDRLSTDRTRGIEVRTDLTPPKEHGFETKYLKRLRNEGILNLELQVGSLDPATTIRVYEFTNAVSGSSWYHGNYQEEVARQWDAESGNVVFSVRRTSPSGMVFTASVTLSNLVFRTDGKRSKRRIERLTISDVPVGGLRL